MQTKKIITESDLREQNPDKEVYLSFLDYADTTYDKSDKVVNLRDIYPNLLILQTIGFAPGIKLKIDTIMVLIVYHHNMVIFDSAIKLQKLVLRFCRRDCVTLPDLPNLRELDIQDSNVTLNGEYPKLRQLKIDCDRKTNCSYGGDFYAPNLYKIVTDSKLPPDDKVPNLHKVVFDYGTKPIPRFLPLISKSVKVVIIMFMGRNCTEVKIKIHNDQVNKLRDVRDFRQVDSTSTYLSIPRLYN